MQVLSVVRSVFEPGLNSMPPMLPRNFDLPQSAESSIETFGELFGCASTLDIVPSGSHDEARLMDLLVVCDLFKDIDKIEVVGMMARVRGYVLVGFPETDLIPSYLVHMLRHETISSIHDESVYLYSQLPSLQPQNNIMLVFLCSGAFLQSVDASLCAWAASSEGRAFSQHVLAGFLEEETMQQTILRVFAMLSFEELIPPRPSETVTPADGFFLSDFGSLLAGKTLANRRMLFRRMACSLLRVVGRNSCPVFSRLFAKLVPDEPLNFWDGPADNYWENKTRLMLDHKSAWTNAWGELKGVLVPYTTEDDMEQCSDDVLAGGYVIVN